MYGDGPQGPLQDAINAAKRAQQEQERQAALDRLRREAEAERARQAEWARQNYFGR